MKRKMNANRSFFAATLLLALMVLPLSSAYAQSARADRDIVQVASDAKFNTLVAAVKAAGLVETLQGKGPFTVFAPTDEAFAKLPAGTIQELLKPENKQALTNILTYHVVQGRVPASEVVKLTSAQTVLGKPVSVQVANGVVSINNAKVVVADIEAANGIVHLIDTVLLPPAEE